MNNYKCINKEKNINPFFINKNIYFKIYIINIILLLLLITYFGNLFLINEIEKKIMRYIKFKKKKI